jgi:hypothetical protein
MGKLDGKIALVTGGSKAGLHFMSLFMSQTTLRCVSVGSPRRRGSDDPTRSTP